jgi:hypothetical protein
MPARESRAGDGFLHRHRWLRTAGGHLWKAAGGTRHFE